MSIRHYSLMCPGGGLLFKVQYGIVFLFKGILRVFQSSILPCSFFLSAVSKLMCVLSVSIQIQTAHSQIFERSKYNICLNFLPMVLLGDAKYLQNSSWNPLPVNGEMTPKQQKWEPICPRFIQSWVDSYPKL